MATARPSVVILAGPNGAGKSTAAPFLLRGALGVTEFVNADVIAQGISAFEPERAAIAAGRIMLTRMKDLARNRVSFAFETTLASRHFAAWLRELTKDYYDFHLVFLWLSSPELAIKRVRRRVRLGGHSVPDETIRRRYRTGLENFFTLYQPLAATWRLYNNSAHGKPRLIAAGGHDAAEEVADEELWQQIRRVGK